MEKVTLEQAKKEFETWFEAKRLPSYLKDKKSDDIDVIVNAIQEGNLVLNEDNTFTQVLAFPTERVSELKYRFRVSEGELAAGLKGIKVDDLVGQMPIGYVSVLTGEVRGNIRALDTADLTVGKAIAAFFST